MYDPTSPVWEWAAGEQMIDCYICKKSVPFNDTKMLASKPSDVWIKHATCKDCYYRIWKG